ncbi:MAG: M23 family metallopeptidase [Acidobacteria bacterium]|nr:M23 family metallopeptidase [Acidobacteriota bacterium]
MFFVYGVVFGAFTTVVYLQWTGQLSAPTRTGTTDVTPQAVATATDPLDQTFDEGAAPPGRGDWLAIPVADVTRSALQDTWGAARGAARKHEAIDIVAPRGTPVLAVDDGSIMKLYRSTGGGITIYQSSADERWIYYYAHLDRYRLGLGEKMTVPRGEVIGYVGTTGNSPKQSPHLHFAIERMPPGGEWWKGEPINPYPVLLRRGRTVPSDSLPPPDSTLESAD